ncbi:hypothetical protein AB0B85_19685 [Micromonospora sp. NPDC049044]|uniref:hypothetical protein n=1 Tax=unclassified Micromonospora TaxID=2617518 RepID=UPI0033D48F39
MQVFLPVLSAALGAVVAFASVWLTQRRTDSRSLQERREQRLLPAYLRYHCHVREWVKSIEGHARAGGITDESNDLMRSAFDSLKMSGYEIDLLAPPHISRAAEEVEDQLLRLTENLGYDLRLASLSAASVPVTREVIKEELFQISDARMTLMVLMQQDLGIRVMDDSSIGVRDENRLLQQ